MPGTKASGRPGGNPNIKEYGFKTDRKYPLTENESLKLDKPTKEKLKAGLVPNWRDIAREAIARAIAEAEEKQKNQQIGIKRERTATTIKNESE